MPSLRMTSKYPVTITEEIKRNNDLMIKSITQTFCKEIVRKFGQTKESDSICRHVEEWVSAAMEKSTNINAISTYVAQQIQRMLVSPMN